MRIRGRWLSLVGAFVALAVGTVAYADTINADGDVVKSGNNVSYTAAANFTERCDTRGTAVAGVVTVKYNGNGIHFDPGTTLTIAPAPDAAGAAAGITTTGGTVSVPDPWDTNGQTFTSPLSTTVPAAVPNGTYVVSVDASGAAHDAHGIPLTFHTTDTYNVSVNCPAPPPAAPTISWVADPSSANEGDLATYRFSIADPDSTSWSFVSGSPTCGSGGSLSGTPSIDSSAKTGTFTCSFPNGPATSTVSVAVSDGSLSSNVLTQSVAVANVAPAVSFTAAPPTAFEGETKTFAFAVNDPGATDTYSTASGYPSCGSGTYIAGSLTVTGNHGSQTGSFACSFSSLGPTTVAIAFTDSDGATGDPATAPVTVQDAPLTAGALTITPGLESLAASQLTFGFTDANPAGAVGDYTATIDWGDSTTSAGTVSAGFTIHGSHTYAEEGNYTVTVTVTDVGGSTASAGGQAVVADAALTAGTLTVGNGVGGVTPAALTFGFADANPAATVADFTATIDWGDTTTSTGTVSASGSGFTVQDSHTYAHAGTFAVTVTVNDTGGSTTSSTGLATIASAPLTAGTLTIGNGVEGVTPAQLTFGFTDANPGATVADYTATINWGDTTSSTGTVTAASGGGFTVQASHTYAEEGAKTVVVIVTSTGGSSATATGHVAIVDAPLTAGTLTITGGVQAATPAQLTFGFTDANPAGHVSDFTATINWGDSTTSAGTVSTAGTGFTVQGSHTYSSSGSFAVTVTVADVGGSTATATGNATIAKSGLTAGQLTIGNGVEGVTPAQLTFRFTSANRLATPADFTATITWGDRKTSTGTVSPAAGGGFTVTGSHLYREEGTYDITVTVSDTSGNSTSAEGHAVIADAPLTATAPTLRPDRSPFSGLTATFTDANPFADEHDFRARIDWGDGDHSFGDVDRVSGGRFVVHGFHFYRHTGYYTIKTKIVDDGGSTASVSTQLLVFAFPHRGVFVVGDRSAGGSVTS